MKFQWLIDQISTSFLKDRVNRNMIEFSSFLSRLIVEKIDFEDFFFDKILTKLIVSMNIKLADVVARWNHHDIQIIFLSSISTMKIIVLIVVLAQTICIYGQGNVCTPANIATCGIYTCVQTDTVFSCLCSNMQLAASEAACNALISSTTQSPIVVPNQCGNAICPAGATCIPTNQNPSQYICLCPNNIIANPDCPVNPLPNNPCLINNPCLNGGTCVVNQLTLQAVCICPTNTYGPNCSNQCQNICNLNWFVTSVEFSSLFNL